MLCNASRCYQLRSGEIEPCETERHLFVKATGPDSKCSLYINQAICVNTQQDLVSVVKEVIQPQVPLRLPCYDFTPVMNHTVVIVLPRVRLTTSGATHSHGVTGGVYKARERIHRGVLIHDY